VRALGAAGGRGEGGRGALVAERLQGLGPQEERPVVPGGVVEQPFEVPEGVAVGAELHRPPPGREEERDGLRGPPAREPVLGDGGRRPFRLGEPPGDLPMPGHTPVRGHPLDQRLPYEVVAEAVPGSVDDEHLGAQRGVEQRTRLRLGQPRDRDGLRRSEVVPGDGEPLHEGQRVGVQLDAPLRDGLPRAPCRAPGELVEEERVAARPVDDALDVGHPGRGRADQERRVLAVERGEVHDDGRPRPRQACHAAPEGRRGGAGAVAEDDEHVARRVHGEVEQHVDRDLVGPVRVVEHQQRGGAGEHPPQRADHVVAGQPALQGRGGRRQRRELGEHRPRRPGEALEQATITRQASLDHPDQLGVRRAPPERGARGDGPAPLAGRRGDPPTQARLAEPGRAAHRERAALAPARGVEGRLGPGVLQGAADELGLRGAQPGDALVVERLGLPGGQHAELLLEDAAQPPVPPDRGGPVAAVVRGAHQPPVAGFVGGVGGDELIPASAPAQQLLVALPQRGAPVLGPLLVERARQQVAGVEVGRRRAPVRVRAAQGLAGGVLEGGDVGDHRDPREQRDDPAAQHHGVRRAQGPAGVVGGLAQVGRARRGVQVWPQGLDHPVTEKPTSVGEREELDELGRPSVGPTVERHLLAPPVQPGATEQIDVDVLACRHRPPRQEWGRDAESSRRPEYCAPPDGTPPGCGHRCHSSGATAVTPRRRAPAARR
jgi:hypothetical protein